MPVSELVGLWQAFFLALFRDFVFTSVMSGHKRETKYNKVSQVAACPFESVQLHRGVIGRIPKNQGTKMLELGAIELQDPRVNIASPIATETIAVWDRASIHKKRKKTNYWFRWERWGGGVLC